MYGKITAEFDNEVSLTLYTEDNKALFYSYPTKDLNELQSTINAIRLVLTKLTLDRKLIDTVNSAVKLRDSLSALLVLNVEEHLIDAPKVSDQQ